MASAEYIYNKEHQTLENGSLLVYMDPITDEQFTINTNGFEPKISSGVLVGTTGAAVIKDSLFTFYVGSSTNQFDFISAIGKSSSNPTVGFNASGNRFYFEGNDVASFSNRLHMIHLDKVSKISIENNRSLISELNSQGQVAGVSVRDTYGSVQGNYISIQASSIKSIRGVTSGAAIKNDGGNGLKIKDNRTIITDTSFNEARGAYMSGARYDSELDGNVLIVINPTVGAKFGISSIIAQELAMSVYDITSSGVTNGVLFLTGKMFAESADLTNQSIEIGAGKSMVSGVSNNRVFIKDFNAEISDHIIEWNTYGGLAKNESSAENNSVTFDNARYTKAMTVYGGISTQGNAIQNGIEIKNGSYIEGSLIGAYAGGEKATDSFVTIENSTVIGTVSIFSGSRSKTKYGSGTLSVSGASDLSQAVLQPYNLDRFNSTDTGLKGYSGETDVTFIADAFSGSIKQLGNVKEKDAAFDHVSLLNQQWDRDGAILSISDTAAFKKSSLTDNSLSFTNAEAVAKGGTITLIEAGNGITYVDPDEANQKELVSTAGTALEFTGKVNFDDQKITYTIDSVESAEQTILVGDSRLAAAAFVNQGSDLLERVFHGFTLSRDKYGLMTFATAEGTKGDYDLSNPIDVNGWNFIAGARSVSAVNSGDLTSAVFVEYGEGNYRTTNSHLGHDFRTDGDMQYMGAGVAVRLMTPSDFYVEGSLRAGQLKSDLDRALMDASGHFYDADTKSIYAGVHLGAGFIAQPIAGMELDSYAKYFFTYTDSDSFKIDTLNETYEFDSITSHRLRLGTRASFNRDNVTFMFGLAGEYEFDAQSDMIAAGAPARTSELDGFSAFAEAGMSLKPSAASPWQFDLQVRGWEGTRDAVSGMATVNYLF